MKNMIQALDDVQFDEPRHAILRRFFEQSSAYVVNQGSAPVVEDRIEEIAPHWDAQLTLDKTVAAIRSGNAELAVSLAGKCSRSVLVGVLALMIAVRDEAMLHYVRDKLTRAPVLVHERYAGRALLHATL